MLAVDKGRGPRASSIILRKLSAPVFVYILFISMHILASDHSKPFDGRPLMLMFQLLQASKRKPFGIMDNEDEDDIDDNLEENSDDSVSDFDDDEDPDKIEIPGLIAGLDFAPGTSAGTSVRAAASSSGTAVVPKAAVVPTPTVSAIKPSFVQNGKPPMMSSLGVPILPVNTATTRVGGPTVARRGGFAGQPFTSE